MARPPCCGEDQDDNKVKKGPWTAEEDEKLVHFITNNGHTNWKSLPKLAGLNRCGKSCRLRWTNYLRPDIKRGKFSDDEERLIINLHSVLGNKWSRIATHMPGRTDNEIKNYYNTHIRKKLLQMGIDPQTHKPRTDHLQLNQFLNLSQLIGAAHQLTALFNNNNNMEPQQNLFTQHAVGPPAAAQAQVQVMQNLLNLLNPTSLPPSSMSTQDEMLLTRILNPSSSSSHHQEMFCNQFLNPVQPPAAAEPAFCAAGEGGLPGLVSAESGSPEGSSSSLKGEMMAGITKMEGGYNNNNNNNYQTNYSSSDGGFSSSPADEGHEYEEWEKLLMMDDFTSSSGGGFFSSWKDDDLLE